MKKFIGFALLLSLVWTAGVTYAQSYDQLWERAESSWKKTHYRSTITQTDEIFDKAKREGNSPQMLKAYTARAICRNIIAPDSFYVDLKGLEKWAEETTVPQDRAILHILIAHTYGEYIDKNRYEIYKRRNVTGKPADDIRKWSGNIFARKIVDHVQAALEDSIVLINTSSKSYRPFVAEGEMSEYYHHNLYHMLCVLGIDALKKAGQIDRKNSAVQRTINRIYISRIRTYLQNSNEEALALDQLERLKWIKESGLGPTVRDEKGNIRGDVDPFLHLLDRFIGRFKYKETCAELYLTKANYLKKQKKHIDALQLCDEAIAKYPSYKRIRFVKELREDILKPYLFIRANSLLYSDQEIELYAKYGNIDGFTVNYYRVNLPVDSPLISDTVSAVFYEKHCTKAGSHHVELKRTGDYLYKDTTLYLKPPGKEGIYLLQVIPDAEGGKILENYFRLTRLALHYRYLPDGRIEFLVLNTVSGLPEPDATIRISKNDEKGERIEIERLTTGADGKAQIPCVNVRLYVRAEKGDDAYMPVFTIYNHYFPYTEHPDKGYEKMMLLTDRAVYRPGQRVFVKGIAYKQFSDSSQVMPDKKLTVKLLDGSKREISNKEVETNEFGSFVTDFELPSACLDGYYRLVAEEGVVFIRVMEYKRPAFEVKLEHPAGEYGLGDSIRLNGKLETFGGGIPLSDIPVSYKVTRAFSHYPGLYDWESMQFVSGKVISDENGCFSIPVVLKPVGNSVLPARNFYVYYVEATATNKLGETQTSRARLAFGNKSLLLSAHFKGKINKDVSYRNTFKAVNLDNRPIYVEGDYKLYPFTDYEKKTVSPHALYTAAFTSNVETEFSGWKSLPSGAYKLVASVRDKRGREVTHESEFVLYSVHDTRPAEKKPLSYYLVDTGFDESHPALFMIGSSEKDACVTMDVFSNKEYIESRTFHLSDSLLKLEYPYLSKYGDGVCLSFSLAKDGKLHQAIIQLQKKTGESKLKLSWKTFRDKLRSGQQEEWQMAIHTEQGTPAEAELLGMMYDASLNKLEKYRGNIDVYYRRSTPDKQWSDGYYHHCMYNFRWGKPAKEQELVYDDFWMNTRKYFALKDFSLIDGYPEEEYDLPDPTYVAQENGMRITGNRSDAGPEEQAVFEMIENDPDATTDRDKYRANFEETALFSPQLRTNEQGEVTLSFTMPESITSWDFKGYAHTKGMQTGVIESEAVTRKEFMLTPNIPRFVREGDRVSIAASIVNLTGDDFSGTATFTLFDPETGKDISVRKQEVGVAAGKTSNVKFLFTATGEYPFLGCRVIAEGGGFSDGEQHLLPVLSKKERVVESLAMSVRGGQTRTFSLEPLFNNNSATATDRRLTVELSANPAWYALQALPSLNSPEDDNAVSWATSHYVNSLASYIANSRPEIKRAIEAGKHTGKQKGTFGSNLQKNRELKNILLEELPWLVEAEEEQEQMERMAGLFDSDAMRSNKAVAIAKLAGLQLDNGGWPWYKGSPGNYEITCFILQTLTRLDIQTGDSLDDGVGKMRRNAFDYLHRIMLNDYNYCMEKAEYRENEHILRRALKYLYLTAISGEKIPDENQEACRYFLDRVGETITSQSVADRACSAIILHEAGRHAEAGDFILSLKQHMTRTDEHGLFFDFGQESCFWYDAKVPAHVMAMEALDRVARDSAAVEEMKVWLLKQKQTGRWRSPVATVNAIYALLNRGADWLGQSGDARVRVAGKTIRTSSAATASGSPEEFYVKKEITNKKLLASPGQAEINKRDKGIAWGAVYARYLEDADKAPRFGEGLQVEKTLYVERTANGAKELLPVTGETVLSVGDKVVSRLTIELDRPMYFIQLKDQRAACLEPLGNYSGYRRAKTSHYYMSVKDSSVNFFFNFLDKGVHVLEYECAVDRAGDYGTGLAVIQSAYSPEFASCSGSSRIKAEE